MELHNPKSYSAIKNLFNCPDMHIEARKGTAQQAAEYCQKEETREDHPEAGPFEAGVRSQQGRRTDIHECADMIKEGKSVTDVAEAHPVAYVKYHKGFTSLYNILNKPKQRPTPEITFHWGDPRTGKSTAAHEEYPHAYIAMDTKEGWFDNYNGEDEVIFDDFQGNFPRVYILKLLDRWPLQLPIKGGWVPVRAHKFYFTSNYDPMGMYDAAFHERLKEFGKIIHVRKPQRNEVVHIE